MPLIAFTMNNIPQFKTGDCNCGCGGKDVAGRKVGKLFYCMDSYRSMKTKQYTQKANLNNKIRNLGNIQVQQGTYEDASVQALKNDLDFVHSRIVRMAAADKITGLANCFVCGRLQHWTMCQLSHFIPRANTLTRWDFKANRCSCKYCNENLGGNLIIFAKKLNEEEPGLAEKLSELSREPYKWGRDELKQLLIDLRAKLRFIETKFKTP